MLVRMIGLVSLLVLAMNLGAAGAEKARRPNLIFILADDLGYAELGSYGQKIIQTPQLDRMAAEGLRFTQFYAGSTVCAPSRCVLMTGLHTGHCTVRGNAGRTDPTAQTLRPEDVTVAEALRPAGYHSALIGKWGLGDDALGTGHPLRQGFDAFYGYLSQHHAHNHYPDFLWRNHERVMLRNEVEAIGDQGAGIATKRIDYAGDLFAQEALAFVEQHRDGPFFLYLSLVSPHANNERRGKTGDGTEVPDYGPYAAQDWPPQDQGHAAMISRLDADVGRLLRKLEELQIAEQTLVLFSSDNGPHREGGQNPDRFQPQGPLRGFKRDLTDGGIRVPLLAWWPGHIQPSTTTDHVAYFGDFFATATELAGVQPPSGLDSISFVPTLLDRGTQPEHDVLYWEFHEGGTSQAVLLDGRWKGILRPGAPLVLYDLAEDLGESTDVAAKHPQLVSRAEQAIRDQRRENAHWPLHAGRKRSR